MPAMRSLSVTVPILVCDVRVDVAVRLTDVWEVGAPGVAPERIRRKARPAEAMITRNAIAKALLIPCCPEE